MKDMTLTQQYFTCAVNGKGKIPGLSTERQVCLLAAGLLELQMEGCISIDKKQICIAAPLPAAKQYLAPLYAFLDKPRPVKMEKLLEAYTYSFTDRYFKKLMASVGKQLAAMGLARQTAGGVFGTVSYVPAKESIHGVTDMMRAELLEEGEVTEEIAALTVLLECGGCLKPYFSQLEQKEMRARLKEMLNSPNGKLVKNMVDYVGNMIAIVTVLATAHS